MSETHGVGLFHLFSTLHSNSLEFISTANISNMKSFADLEIFVINALISLIIDAAGMSGILKL